MASSSRCGWEGCKPSKALGPKGYGSMVFLLEAPQGGPFAMVLNSGCRKMQCVEERV